MTGSTQLIGAGQDDASSSNTPIGFDFWLQGVRYTQFSVTSNGFIGLSSTGGSVSNTNYSITGGSAALPLIAGCGGDLETAATGGKIHYKVTGAAPNRVLTVEFTNMTIVYSGVTPEADGTFQVRLYETTGQIEFVYGPMMRGALTGSGVGNSGNLGIGYFVAAANGSLVSIVSATNAATTTTPFTQQAYPTGPIANLDSPGGDGTRRLYSLTPPSATPPTDLSFTNVTIFYGDLDADRSTGGEIPASRTVTNVSFDSEGPNVTIAGGDLTVAGTATFGDAADVSPNGRVITGANNLIIGSSGTVTRVGGLGHVDGNLRKTAVAGTQTFEVGTANGYSPVDANVTAGAGNVFTAKATQGAHPQSDPAMSLARYWTTIAPGVTADLTFHYLPVDVPGGWPGSASVYLWDGTNLTQFPGGMINTGPMTLTAPGAALLASRMRLNTPLTATRDFVGGVPLAPLTASSAVSRKVHGGAGTFDINLPLSGSPGIESRSGGGTNAYQVVVTFASPVTVSTAAVTSGTGSVSTASSNGTNTITVDLTGVANAQYLTVTLQGATNGTNSGDIPVTMGVLVGDVSANGSVNGTDVNKVKLQSGGGVGAGNFRSDVNANGSISGTDINIVKLASGTALP